MPPREKAIITPAPSPADAAAQLFQFPELPEAPEEMALDNIIADLGGEGADAKICVYRVQPGKPNAYVGEFTPLEFSLEHLQQNFGPGDYKIHVRQNGKLRANRMIAIAQARALAPINVPVPAPARDDTRELVESMRAGFSGMAEMLRDTLRAVVEAQPKPKTTLEMLQEMQLMRSVFDSGPKQDPMQVIELAATLADKIQPRSGDVGTGELLLEAIKNFGPMFTAGRATAPDLTALMAPSPLTAPINPSAPLPAPVEPAQSQEDQPMLVARYYLKMLMSHAEAEHDPAIYAEVVLDTVGDAKARDFLGGEGWIDRLAAYDERVKTAPYLAWFAELRRCILDLTEEPNAGNDANIVPTPAIDATISKQS